MATGDEGTLKLGQPIPKRMRLNMAAMESPLGKRQQSGAFLKVAANLDQLVARITSFLDGEESTVTALAAVLGMKVHAFDCNAHHLATSRGRLGYIQSKVSDQDAHVMDEPFVPYVVGDRVLIWSSSQKRWFDDGEVQEVALDGSLFVRYNNGKPSGKRVPVNVARRIVRRPVSTSLPSSSARGSLRKTIGTGAGPADACRRTALAFKTFSAGHEGMVTPEELLEGMHSSGIPCGQQDLSGLRTTCNGSGKISFASFVSWLYGGTASWASGPSTMPGKTNPQVVFERCVVVLCPLGGGALSAMRRSLLAERIRECGGQVANTWSQEVTHLVVAPHLSRESLHRLYRGVHAGVNFRGVVTDAWLSDCLVSGKLVPERHYLWHAPRTQPLEASPQTHAQLDPQLRVTTRPAASEHMKRKRGSTRARSPSDSERSDATSAVCDEQSWCPEKLRLLVIEEFRTCAECFSAQGDKWRSWQYRKAQQLVEHVPGLTAGMNFMQLGLTAKFAKKCKTIARRRELPQATAFRRDTDMHTLLELTRIHGVGDKLAMVWLKMGVASLEDVRRRVHELPSTCSGKGAPGLTSAQRLGLKMVDDFADTLDRSEVERINAKVSQHIGSLGIVASTTLCGGYRHGDVSCKGVTIVVAVNSKADVLTAADLSVSCLRQAGCILAEFSRANGFANQSSNAAVQPAGWVPPATQVCMCAARGEPQDPHGVSRCRRLDLVFCAEVSLPFVTLQWTGNDGGLFNRELKRLAALKGFHLSPTFLCRAKREIARGRQVGEVGQTGPCLPCRSESDIFQALGLPHRTPEQRHIDSALMAAVDEAAKGASAAREGLKAVFKAMPIKCSFEDQRDF
mmetsp:Transcript_35629/g.81668  ORF Transcript_35629/g.81668 Transcript_35629/m.81668 type:complete len:852 (-) Transcript_35629:10-2565(-)